VATPEAERVASVLVAAALEETLKQVGSSTGLDAYGKDMRSVIELLRTAGALVEPQLSLAYGFVAFRDKAFHAHFDQIARSTTEATLKFIQGLLGTAFV
jgi:hypothetical protein